MKVHCRWRWRATLTLSGSREAEEEWESRSARPRAVGGSGRFLEEGWGLIWKTRIWDNRNGYKVANLTK